MIDFNLKLNILIENLSAVGKQIKAISCIEYPILHIIANTTEQTEEEYDTLDKFIIEAAYKYKAVSISILSALTDLHPRILLNRCKQLSKEKYINILDQDVIIPVDAGITRINDPVYERLIKKTRTFLLDGVTHNPLPAYFYRDGLEFLLSEEIKDAFGKKIINPCMVHTPPGPQLVDSILAIKQESRIDYHIPVGLKEFNDYDFKLMTFPVGIVFIEGENNEITKRLLNCNEPYADFATTEMWEVVLQKDLRQTCITWNSTSRTDHQEQRTFLTSGWGKHGSGNEQSVYDLSPLTVVALLKNHFKLSNIETNCLQITSKDLILTIDHTFFTQKQTYKRRLLEAALNKKEYIYFRPKRGVWFVTVNIIVNDPLIIDCVQLYQQIRNGIVFEDLLALYPEQEYPKLRKLLLTIEQFDYLEELDILLYMHTRKSKPLYSLTTLIDSDENYS